MNIINKKLVTIINKIFIQWKNQKIRIQKKKN